MPDVTSILGFSWNPQTYSCIVKQGDPDWLNFVNVALRESMTGTTFPLYKAAYETWFGESPPEPRSDFLKSSASRNRDRGLFATFWRHLGEL